MVQRVSDPDDANGTLTLTYVLQPLNGPENASATPQTYTVRGLSTNQRVAEAVRATWNMKPDQVFAALASAVTTANMGQFLDGPELISHRAKTTVTVTRVSADDVTGTLTIYYRGQVTGPNNSVLATAATEQSTTVRGFLTYQQAVDQTLVEFTPPANDLNQL